MVMKISQINNICSKDSVAKASNGSNSNIVIFDSTNKDELVKKIRELEDKLENLKSQNPDDRFEVRRNVAVCTSMAGGAVGGAYIGIKIGAFGGAGGMLAGAIIGGLIGSIVGGLSGGAIAETTITDKDRQKALEERNKEIEEITQEINRLKKQLEN